LFCTLCGASVLRPILDVGAHLVRRAWIATFAWSIPPFQIMPSNAAPLPIGTDKWSPKSAFTTDREELAISLIRTLSDVDLFYPQPIDDRRHSQQAVLWLFQRRARQGPNAPCHSQ